MTEENKILTGAILVPSVLNGCKYCFLLWRGEEAQDVCEVCKQYTQEESIDLVWLTDRRLEVMDKSSMQHFAITLNGIWGILKKVIEHG